MQRFIRRPRLRRLRRAFSLVEMLVALAITAALLTAVMVALHASFVAYQRTTEVASTHTISRLVMHRMLTLIRTGRDFGPYPLDPRDPVVFSTYLEFYGHQGQLMRLEWIEEDEALYIVNIMPDNSEERHLLLEGVTQRDEDDNYIPPFTLEYVLGSQLYRATIDLTVVPDDNMSVQLDGANTDVLRLVASAMPRNVTY